MTRSHVALALAALTTYLGGAEDAAAKCASPRPVFAPASGARLPENPTIYYFAPKHLMSGSASLIVESAGKSVPAKLELVSTTEAYLAFKVTLKVTGARRVTISALDDRATTTTYEIDPSWTPPSSREIEIVSRERVDHRWTCSYTKAQVLSLTAAPAYQVTWARNRQAFRRGETTTAVFPFHTTDFFGPGQTPRNGQVALGHVNCFGRTAPEDLGDDLVVRVVGLLPDGTMLRASNDDSSVLYPGCGTALARQAAQRAAERRRKRGAGPRWGWLALLFPGLLGFTITRRRLRDVSRDTIWLRAICDAFIPNILFVVYTMGSVGLALNIAATAASGVSPLVAVITAAASCVAGGALALLRAGSSWSRL